MVGAVSIGIGQSTQARRSTPNIAKLLYSWEPTLGDVTLNGADVSAFACRDNAGAIVSANAFAQAVGANQALWNANDAAFGGRPSIEFAGAEYYATAGNVTLPDSATWVFVTKQTGSGFRVLLECGDPNFQASPGAPIVSHSGASWGFSFSSVTTATRTFTEDTSPVVLVLPCDPSVANAPFPASYANGSASGGSNAGTSTATVLADRRWQLGGRAGGSLFWTGALAGMYVFTGILNATEAQDEYLYLKAKFSL
jgi:hypothetical protein